MTDYFMIRGGRFLISSLAWLALGGSVPSALGATQIDMTNSFYGSGTSLDVGADILVADGYVFTAGAIYGGFGTARLSTTGVLAPGAGANSWGFGKVNNPTASPLGWMAFYPYSANGTPSASSMALHDGLLYLTGPAAAGVSAGFGVVSLVDGSVSNVRSISPRDSSVPGLGATPGGDILIHDDMVYLFGGGTVASGNDVAWVGRRDLDGTADYGYGDNCPGGPTSPCYGLQSGFSVLGTGYASASYGDTVVASDTAYSVFRTSSSGTNGRILVTALGLNPVTLLQSVFEDGSSTSTYSPQAIAVQSDGKFVIAGYEGTSYTWMFMTRYLSDGTIDSSFGTGGKVTLNLSPYQDDIRDIAIVAGGKILAVGASGEYAFSARFLDDGSLDTSYSPTGYQLLSFLPTRTARFNGISWDGTTMRATGATSNGGNPNLLFAELIPAP